MKTNRRLRAKSAQVLLLSFWENQCWSSNDWCKLTVYHPVDVLTSLHRFNLSFRYYTNWFHHNVTIFVYLIKVWRHLTKNRYLCTFGTGKLKKSIGANYFSSGRGAASDIGTFGTKRGKRRACEHRVLIHLGRFCCEVFALIRCKDVDSVNIY